MPERPFLPYGRQSVDEDDIAAVVDVLRGDTLTTGPAVAAFEEILRAKTGAPFADAVSNGTTALHLAYIALGVREGDTVIVPSVTFVATANAARYCGAEVVFADVDPATGLMTPETFQRAVDQIGKPPKAVAPVHLGGRLVDMAALSAIATELGTLVLEDACHAIGGTYGDGSPVGSCGFSDAAVFSFHPVKTVAAGEGGAITCKEKERSDTIRSLRSHGVTRVPEQWHDRDMIQDDGSPAPWYYEMPEMGYNYRIPDILCALGHSQMKKLDRFVAQRRKLADLYDQAFDRAGLRSVSPCPKQQSPGGAWHLYQIAIDFDAYNTNRSTVMDRLRAAQIGTQVHYIPVHLQPYYRDRNGDYALPGAEEFYRTTLTLPLYPSMTEDDVQYVVTSLCQALSH